MRGGGLKASGGEVVLWALRGPGQMYLNRVSDVNDKDCRKSLIGTCTQRCVKFKARLQPRLFVCNLQPIVPVGCGHKSVIYLIASKWAPGTVAVCPRPCHELSRALYQYGHTRIRTTTGG